MAAPNDAVASLLTVALLGSVGSASSWIRVRDACSSVVEAADAARRRLERNLHDGAQQRLVAASLALRLAEIVVGDDGNGGADPANGLNLYGLVDRLGRLTAVLRAHSRDGFIG